MAITHSNRKVRGLQAVVLAIALSFGGLILPGTAQATDGFAAAAQAQSVVSPSAGTVEQGDFLWFNLSGFTPDTSVQVDLINGAGESVTAPVSFTIGSDGNTLNPDGHTYRRITAPRTGPTGSGFKLRVTSGGATLAESTSVAVTPATTKVYNTGDHALGVEDLETEQHGSWTFRAKNFTPGAKLTATTMIRDEPVVLEGEGQVSSADKSWQLDVNGDTSTTGYTRLTLPAEAPVGTLPIVFSDGTITRTVNMVVLPASDAKVTVAASAPLGGTIRITGSGWTHPSSQSYGSRIAIKIDDGAVVRLNTDVNSNRTVWWIVDADADGNFVVDMPMPNGTTEGEHGTRRAFDQETFTLRFLSGLLREDDFSRSVESNVITVGEAPAVDVATSTTVSLSKTRATYNSGVTATVRVAAAGTSPTGKVTLGIAGRSYSATLKNGTARVKLDRAVAPGTRAVTARYNGAAGFSKSTGKATLTVTKAKPSVSVKLAKAKIKASQRATAKVTVKLPGSLGAKPSGKVAVYVGKKKVATGTVKSNGKVDVKLSKLKKGTYKVKVKVLANSKQTSRTSSSKTLRVVR